MKHLVTALLASLLLMPAYPARAAVPALADSAMAFVAVPVAHLREKPAHSSEMVSQALLGTPVCVTDTVGEWIAVILPDSYPGYISSSSLVAVSPDDFARWKSSDRVIVTAPATVDVVADTVRGGRITYLMNGTVVCGHSDPGSGYFAVTMPDGGSGYIPQNAAMPFPGAFSRYTDTDIVLSTASLALGAPYLWGGTTLLAPDCSGLVKRAYFAAGLLLPRDASQQALAGIEIPLSRPDLWKRGDLLFFTNDAGTKITHVAIYDRRGRFIHSSGKVFIASVYPEDDLYIPRRVARVVRIAGCEDTPGIIRLTSHPWYF
ncbi:MAG: C40 family peptidase [Paramuribaculum sp.]|nr:C40 family peptidase [Paramuribaculum sp.]